ncbi:MAG: TAT-variant-translocated molybdopterin oxidoreductase, partial [Chloroflexota bacterium]|nr:TAT-variant-translocated molybdopterin oxidoreductase [Chloroflexota bacterium]
MSSINLNSADVTVPLTREKNIASPAITRRLKGKTGKEYWRSLEELADTKEFREMIRKNFPSSASEFIDSMSRRRFLKLMGASLALAGVTGCSTKPSETLVPYVEKPEELILGRPLFYATAMTLGGATNGLLIEQREGRPIKVEGNPRHPNSLGSTDVFSQASLLTMYDPDRSETIRKLG